ncbi:DinB family protein [Cesiribacter sp. SM1]|uniref:DinB family protein n=1 Tax=Cesiribacter sp. SM1 TaxID=2861196 RepID=UPI001CD3CB6A|nr:DinB family protein [Cesiribacter sp. SM1]
MEAAFKDWFAYNHQANETMIGVLQNRGLGLNKAMEICSHILTAHQIWLNRIYPIDKQQHLPWEKHDQLEYGEINNQNYQNTLLFLQSVDMGMHLDKPIPYQNTKGVPFINSIQEIYFHILAHSAYHRGQLTLLLRQADIAPPLSDYIFFKRDMQ